MAWVGSVLHYYTFTAYSDVHRGGHGVGTEAITLSFSPWQETVSYFSSSWRTGIPFLFLYIMVI